jgi:hypothetical protein
MGIAMLVSRGEGAHAVTARRPVLLTTMRLEFSGPPSLKRLVFSVQVPERGPENSKCIV